MDISWQDPMYSPVRLVEDEGPEYSNLAYSLTEYRHLPPGRAACAAGRGGEPDQPRPAKTFGWDRDKICNLATKLEQRLYSDNWPALRPHQLAALAAHHRSCKRHRAFDWYEYQGQKKLGTRKRRAWSEEAAEGRDLAGSVATLPSDRDRARRPPSLERQEAFRDAKTTKKSRSGASTPASDAALSQPDHNDAEDKAELYRLGLLYDDEHERGPGFGFGAIVHDEPAYTLNVRRGRGRKRKAEAAALGWDDEASLSMRLPLDLSFAALGDDETIAAFLMSPDPSEFAFADEDEEDEDEKTMKMMTADVPGSSQVRPSLQVIYETDDGEEEDDEDEESADNDNTVSGFPSANTSIDIDHTTHSLTDKAAVPAAHDFPDLIPDLGARSGGGNDDEENDGEWAILAGSGADARAPTPKAMDDDDDATNNGPDAWIVLG